MNSHNTYCSLFDLSKVHLISGEVGGGLHRHNLKETNHHDQNDKEHNQDAWESVRVQIILNICISRSNLRGTLGWNDLLKGNKGSRVRILAAHTDNTHDIGSVWSFLHSLLNVLAHSVDKSCREAFFDINDSNFLVDLLREGIGKNWNLVLVIKSVMSSIETEGGGELGLS